MAVNRTILAIAVGAATLAVVVAMGRRSESSNIMAAAGDAETKNKVLVIGCAGAVGTALAEQIIAMRGAGSVVAALRRTPLPVGLAERCVCEFGVDVRDAASLERVLAKHAASIECVWNLAAPLSVETATDPAVAEAVTVGGNPNPNPKPNPDSQPSTLTLTLTLTLNPNPKPYP